MWELEHSHKITIEPRHHPIIALTCRIEIQRAAADPAERISIMGNTKYPQVYDMRGYRPNAARPYQAYWWNPYADPPCKGGTSTFETPEAADVWVRAMERRCRQENQAAGVADMARDSKIGFREFAERWITTQQVDRSISTVESYTRSIRVLNAYFGDQPLRSIGRTEVQALQHYLYATHRPHKPLSAGTRRLHLTVLRKILRDAVITGACDTNPMDGETLPRVARRGNQGHILTSAEFGHVLEHLDRRYWAPLLIAYHAGLRIGEVCGLRAANLDLTNGWVTVINIRHQSKREDPRRKGGQPGDGGMTFALPLSVLPRLRTLLADYPQSPEGHAFSMIRRGGTIGPLEQARLRDHFKSACRKAGIDSADVRFHGVRHACAYSYVNAGADPRETQRALGHADIRTTMIYFPEVSPDRLRELADSQPPVIDEDDNDNGSQEECPDDGHE